MGTAEDASAEGLSPDQETPRARIALTRRRAPGGVRRLNRRNETQPARVQPRSPDEIRVSTAARVVPAAGL